jgi:hypothetical protein
MQAFFNYDEKLFGIPVFCGFFKFTLHLALLLRPLLLSSHWVEGTWMSILRHHLKWKASTNSG